MFEKKKCSTNSPKLKLISDIFVYVLRYFASVLLDASFQQITVKTSGIV